MGLRRGKGCGTRRVGRGGAIADVLGDARYVTNVMAGERMGSCGIGGAGVGRWGCDVKAMAGGWLWSRGLEGKWCGAYQAVITYAPRRVHAV